MSTYVVADLHGCYDAFQRLLRKIDFKWGSDELIVAGDITDRGPQSYEMLRWMEEKKDEVTFIMGNHDVGLHQTLRVFSKFMKDERVRENSKKLFYVFTGAYRIGLDKYGTVRELLNNHDISSEDMDAWADIIEKFPYYIEKNINGRDYIICHAGYLDASDYSNPDFRANMIGFDSEKHFNLWAREEMLEYGGRRGATCVFGHTPTISPRSVYYNSGRVFILEDELLDCKFINIDCGYVYKNIDSDANMAAIRLEDEEIFYLE